VNKAQPQLSRTRHERELASLRELSARVGSDPLLVQASNGNTSIKLDGILWIKASGKWLAHASQEEALVPVELAEAREAVEHGTEIAKPDVLKNKKFRERLSGKDRTPPFAVVERRGVVLNERMTSAQRATLIGLVQVTQRTEESARLRYLNGAEVEKILNEGAYTARRIPWTAGTFPRRGPPGSGEQTRQR
jgi:hypothetical protein